MKRRIATLMMASCLFLLPPAEAALEDALKPLPAAPAGVMVLETDPAAWKYFASRKPFSDLSKDKAFSELSKELAKEGIDLEKDLFPHLGSHLALAYYPDAAHPDKGAVIAALLLKTPLAAGAIQARLLEKLKDHPISKKSSGGQTLYLVAPKPDESESKEHLGLVQHQNVLMIGLSEAAADLQRLEAAPSGAVLKDPVLTEISTQMQKQKIWMYVEKSGLKLLAKAIDETEDSEALAELLPGLGLGVNPSQEGLELRAYLPYGPASELRSYFQQLQAVKGGLPLSGLWPYLPEKPAVLLAGQRLDAFLKHPVPPFGGEFAALQQEIDQAGHEILSSFAEATGLDLNRDLLNHLDGRYALSFSSSELEKGGLEALERFNAKATGTLLLGIREAQRERFFQTLATRLRLDLNKMEDPYEVPRDIVKGNIGAVHEMLGDYAAGHGGRYPAKVAQLHTDALARHYWKEVRNPVNQRTGIGVGQALLDHAVYKGFKPQTAFAGMVFYQPYGKPDARGAYPGYQIYGYAPDGGWWQQSNAGELLQSSELQPKLQLNLKPRIVPIEKLNYEGQTFYVARFDQVVPDWKAKSVRLCWTQVGEFLVVGLNPESLIETLKDVRKPPRTGQLADLLKRNGAESQNVVAYVDLRQFKGLASEQSQNAPLPEQADEALDPFVQAMRYFYLDQRYGETGHGGGLMLGLDMDKIDFETLFKTFGEDDQPSLQDEPASSKSNMHVLQTISGF